MTADKWASLLVLFAANEKRLCNLEPTEPIFSARFWRESAHGTLGHLTACQSAWLPLLRMIRDGQKKGKVEIRPDPLYTKLGFKSKDWSEILKQFKKERAEWRKLLREINLDQELTTPYRVLSARTLTKRLVDHEKRHLDDLQCVDED